MKKFIVFVVACVMSVAAQAQTDSTLRKTDSEEALQPGVPRGYVIIRAEEIPTTLQTTLQAPEYYGWERGQIYQNRRNSQYLVVIGTGTGARQYTFDRNGNPVKKP